ncbi:MAG: 1-acyl-sn-glycerol-3-phosphate acyltransferase [Desulfomonile tiedjei]|nr:1-acyl-sn-glycerol-3-phosphate acyltransferase [Desulfomonile tiedjei]
MKKLITLLSSRVQVDDEVVEKIRQLARTGPIVYAMKYRSIYDLHFLRLRFAELGLPVPAFAFDVSAMDSWSLSKAVRVWRAGLNGLLHEPRHKKTVNEEDVKEILDGGGAGVVFLVDEKTARSRYIHPSEDPIRILLDLQGKLSGAIAVVPIFILYDRTPRPAIRPFWEIFLGDPDNPGPIRRLLIALRKWTVPEFLMGEPVHLVGEFEEFGSEESWEELPFTVRQKLIAGINERIRVNRGPEKLSRTEIKERVLQDPRVQRAVREGVSNEDHTEEKIRKRAESFVDEIAADQTSQTLHFLYYLLKWLLTRVFDGMDLSPSGFSVLKRANTQGSLIFTSCHKSHFDYLIVGYLSFINQMPVPHMAAGKNLAFWPVGRVLRTGGAFFLRRTFGGLALYTHVFAAYLKVLVKEKVNINFYIEGGRSRTGKLLPPRVGMLAFLVQAVEEGGVEDLTFVPTFVGYDQIPEENDYLRELAGREKQKETFVSLIRARDILTKRFGKVYVRFHEPLSFVEFCTKMGVQPNEGRLSQKETRRLLTDFAYYLMDGIVKVGVIGPVDLFAAALTCSRRNRVDHDRLMKSAAYLSDMLRVEGCEFAASLDKLESAVQPVLGLFRMRGFVEVEPVGGAKASTEYIVNGSKRANLEFYRNALINYLWAGSLISNIILRNDSGASGFTPAMAEEFQFLKQLLSKELICNPLVGDDEIMERTLGLFRDQGWVSGGQPLNREALECLKGVTADLLEVYYLVLATAETVEEGGIYQKEFIKKMVKTAQEMHAGQERDSVPSLPSVTVGNAVLRFSEMGILEYRQSKKFLKGVGDHAQKNEVRDRLAKALE